LQRRMSSSGGSGLGFHTKSLGNPGYLLGIQVVP